MSAKVGRWAFIGGLVVAVLVGFLNLDWAAWLLVVLGLVVGFMNVSGSESQSFLIAAVALAITSSSLAGLPIVGSAVDGVLSAVVVFVSAATVVVAVKSLLEVSQN